MNREIRLPQSCPECGGEVTLIQAMLTFPGPVKTVIFCNNCGWKREYADVGSVIVGDAADEDDEEISEVERENDRYNQEQDWLENHGRELE